MARSRYKGVVHLQHLREDGPRLGLYHSKGMLYNGVYP